MTDHSSRPKDFQKETAQLISKKKKPLSKKVISVAKKPHKDSNSTKTAGKKSTKRKTIFINPLATARGPSFTHSDAKISASNSVSQRPKIIQGEDQIPVETLAHKVPFGAPPIDDLAVGQIQLESNYADVSIEYFKFNGWHKIKISFKNRELGIIALNNHFYPLRTFKLESASRYSFQKFVKLDQPKANIGLLSRIMAALPSLRPACIFGFLFCDEGDGGVYVRLDKTCLAALERAKSVVK